MYGGAIASRGPRYCPSVEDKIVRFPDAERHQLFLEPEGHDTHELYVNGLSTSLPAPVQLAVLRSIPGLARRRDDARRLCDRVRLLSADTARRDAPGSRHRPVCTSRARSTGRPGTRKPRGRDSSPARTPPRSALGALAIAARSRALVHRRSDRRSRHAWRRRAVSTVHVTLGVSTHDSSGQCAPAARTDRSRARRSTTTASARSSRAASRPRTKRRRLAESTSIRPEGAAPVLAAREQRAARTQRSDRRSCASSGRLAARSLSRRRCR